MEKIKYIFNRIKGKEGNAKKIKIMLVVFGVVLLISAGAYVFAGGGGGDSSRGVTQIERGEIVAFTDVGSHTWTVPEGVHYVDVLVVAGGGGGGWRGGDGSGGGGGGAGGILFESSYSVNSENVIPIFIGSGGNVNSESSGDNGENSSFGNLVAIGGGGGARFTVDGNSGGSGGGAAGRRYSGGSEGGEGIENQGNEGGSRDYIGDAGGAGGGGGGSSGENIINSLIGRKGGEGLYFGDVFGNQYGEDGWFAGGGGGGAGTGGISGTGGTGGGGSGNSNAISNTGGGGGGGNRASPSPGNGGSGIVLIRYGAKTQISPIQSGLVGHWTLDEDSYNPSTQRVTDKSFYENHGTNSGATFTTDRKGRDGGAMEFDGSSNYFGMPNDQTLDLTGEFTISVWIKPYSFGGGSNWGLIDRGGYSQYQLKVDTSGRVVSSLWHSGERRDYCYGVGDGAPLNEWSHALITYDGVGTVKSYMNGIPQCSHTRNEGAIDSKVATLNIGRASNYYWDGLMDDVRIYNRALSEDEIKSLYESYNPIASAGSLNKGLVLDMPLRSPYTKDETVGSEIMTDRTPYSNDGQNSGATIKNEGAEFGGSDDIRIIYEEGLYVPTEITISTWINPTNVGGGWQTIIAHSPVSPTIYNYWFYLGENSLRLSAYSTTYPDLTVNNIMTQNDEWYHVAFTAIKGGSMKIFVGGIEVGSGTAGNSNFRTEDFVTIGDLRPGRNLRFDGKISNVRIYNRALSEQEIKLLYDKGRW